MSKDPNTPKTAEVVALKRAKAKGGKAGKCPICGKPTQADYAPFCSKRCADIDLGKWLGEGYRIPTEEVPGFDDSYGDDE